jgi:hypothetical protein
MSGLLLNQHWMHDDQNRENRFLPAKGVGLSVGITNKSPC